MKKVTRTIPTLVVRYKNASGETNVKLCESLEPTLVSELVTTGAQEIEMGYAPLLYSLNEKDYIEAAECLTDVETVKLYKEKKDCPTTSDRKKNK